MTAGRPQRAVCAPIRLTGRRSRSDPTGRAARRGLSVGGEEHRLKRVGGAERQPVLPNRAPEPSAAYPGPPSRATKRPAGGSCRSHGREEHAPTASWKTTEQFSTATTGPLLFHQVDIRGHFITSLDSTAVHALTRAQAWPNVRSGVRSLLVRGKPPDAELLSWLAREGAIRLAMGTPKLCRRSELRLSGGWYDDPKTRADGGLSCGIVACATSGGGQLLQSKLRWIRRMVLFLGQ